MMRRRFFQFRFRLIPVAFLQLFVVAIETFILMLHSKSCQSFSSIPSVAIKQRFGTFGLKSMVMTTTSTTALQEATKNSMEVWLGNRINIQTTTNNNTTDSSQESYLTPLNLYDDEEQRNMPDNVLLIADGKDSSFPPVIRIKMKKTNNLGEHSGWMINYNNRLYSCYFQEEKEVIDDNNLIIVLVEPNQIIGTVITLDDENNGQEQAMAAIGSVEWILVDTTTPSSSSKNNNNENWKMIPAENLIGAATSTGTKIAFVVNKPSDVGGLAKALEIGIDGLCVISTNFDGDDDDDDGKELWTAVFEARKERNLAANDKSKNNFPIQTKIDSPKITSSGSCWRRSTTGGKPIIADRVCVDFVQNLLPEEGCWVGSSAKIMTLVLSEASSSQYVPTRPFRVNAGPVHSYILMGDNKTTKYLSELIPSDQVAVYNAITGQSRSVAVGRLKQEVRPCVLIELQSSSSSSEEGENEQSSSMLPQLNGQIFLQQAETVRLGQKDGKFLRVTDLAAEASDDDRVGTGAKGESSNNDLLVGGMLLRLMTTGTHIGGTYSGKVEER